jgi:hypothetical protein
VISFPSSLPISSAMAMTLSSVNRLPMICTANGAP